MLKWNGRSEVPGAGLHFQQWVLLYTGYFCLPREAFATVIICMEYGVYPMIHLLVDLKILLNPSRKEKRPIRNPAPGPTINGPACLNLANQSQTLSASETDALKPNGRRVLDRPFQLTRPPRLSRLGGESTPLSLSTHVIIANG